MSAQNLGQIFAAVLQHLIDGSAPGVVPGTDVGAVGDEQLDHLVGVLARPLLNSVDNGGVGRLWPTTGVEDQRVLPLAPTASVV